MSETPTTNEWAPRMTVVVDCPHTMPMAGRDCTGCTETAEEGSPDRAVERWCDGEVTATVAQDSDGDADVIGGVRQFLTVERLSTSCGCVLTDAERKAVIDQYLEDYDAAAELEAMAEDDARLEANW